MKFRSGFEKRLAEQIGKFTYECTILQYAKNTNRKMVCLECGSKDVVIFANYLTDFKLPNGIFIEAKGWFKPADRTKMVAVRKANPDLDIRMVFEKQGWCTKQKRNTYTDWCDKNNFKWAIGHVPEEWLDE